MDVEVTALADVSRSTVAAWRDLYHRAVEPNPFFGPELVLTAAELLDSQACHLVSVSDSGRFLACLPVRSPTRWGPARRRLEREIGAPLRLVERSDVAGVERFLQLEVSGWKGRQGTAFASNPKHAQLVRRWCATLEEERRLQVLFLKAGDWMLAAQVNVLGGDGLFGFKVAYDERFARRPPGVLLELEARELWCASGRGTFMDSCAAEHNSVVNRVFPGRRTLGTLLLPLGGVVSSAAVATVPRVRDYLQRWRHHGVEVLGRRH